MESQVAVLQSPIWEDEGGMWAAHVGCLEVCATSFRLHFLLGAVCHPLSGRIGVAPSAKTAHTLRSFLRRSLTGCGTTEAERLTDESVQEFWVFAGDLGD